MKASAGRSDEQKKMAAVAVFVLIAAAIFYFEYFDTGSPSTPVAATAPATPASNSRSSAAAGDASAAGSAIGPEAKKVGTTSAGLDPTLHMDAMLASEAVEYSGTGRNIFSANSAPVVPIPSPIAPARRKPVQVAQILAPQRPSGPPPPPPIDLKFFGIETSGNGRREAFLLHGDGVYTAAAGDVVLRRYRVIAVDPKTIQVEDMQNKNTQTLPLLVN